MVYSSMHSSVIVRGQCPILFHMVYYMQVLYVKLHALYMYVMYCTCLYMILYNLMKIMSVHY